MTNNDLRPHVAKLPDATMRQVRAVERIEAIIREFPWIEQENIINTVARVIPQWGERETVKACLGSKTFTSATVAKKLRIKPTAACNRVAALERLGLARRVGKNGRELVFELTDIALKGFDPIDGLSAALKAVGARAYVRRPHKTMQGRCEHKVRMSHTCSACAVREE